MVEYNPFSDQVIDDPHPVYKRLRAEAPVYYIEQYDAWALSRFDDIWTASMDEKSYTAAKGTTAAHLLTKVQPVTPMLNLMDPPQHTQLRSQVRGFFTPGSVRKLQERIQGFVDDAVDGFREAGECDAFMDFAGKVAVKVACTANGIPLEDGDMLNKLVWRFFGREEGVTGMTADGVAAAVELNEYFVGLIQSRRKSPGDEPSVLKRLLEVEIDGEKLPDEAIASHLSMLIIGGAETFPKVFASAIYRLHQHPDQRAKCAADPSLIPDAFNETLRYDMPTQFLARVVTRELEIRDKKLKPGQPVLFLYPSANRDEQEFEDADRFDIERRPPRILSFGHGIHACLGAHFARLEGKLCLEATLSKMPDYVVHEDRLERFRTEFVQGFAAIPISFEPF